MLQTIKLRARAIVDYLSVAAHRRFVATIVALATTHIVGRALDAESVAIGIEIVIGGLGGAWSKTEGGSK